MRMDRRRFEDTVAAAMDRLPVEFAELISNVVVQVREAPDRETIESVGLDPRRATLLGLYTGVPLEQRGGWYGNVLPDVIVLYRRPLLEGSRSRRHLIRNIQLTLLHELGHHFGLDDDEMAAWEEEFEGLAGDDPADETVN
jgi:predicted Zn-dependent protease with MMP-like domain